MELLMQNVTAKFFPNNRSGQFGYCQGNFFLTLTNRHAALDWAAHFCTACKLSSKLDSPPPTPALELEVIARSYALHAEGVRLNPEYCGYSPVTHHPI